MYLFLALSQSDIAVTLGIMVGALFIVLLAAGWWTKRWTRDSSDYLLGGREVGLLVNVFGVTAIGFAGTAISLVCGWTVWFGLTGAMVFNVGYIGVGIILYGVLFTKFIRRNGAQTLPEWLEMRFSRSVRLLVTITTTIGLLGILANNIASMAVQISGFTGWAPLFAISLTFAIFIIFTYLGGFWAVTVTDFIQMVIGFIALPVLAITLIAKYGGNIAWAGAMTQGVTGVPTPSVFGLVYPSVLTTFLAFGAFLVWGNNYYWLRVASCRSERVARKSYVYAGLLLFFVINGLLMVVGLYAGTNLPGAFASLGAATGAYGAILREVPLFIASLALLGSLVASVSTATTAHIGATAVVVRDIYNRVLNPTASQEQLVKASKIVMLALGILVYFLSYFPGGPAYLFAFATAFLGPCASLVFFGTFWRRTTKTAAFWSMLVSIIVLSGVAVYDLLQKTPLTQFNMKVGIYPGALGFFIAFGLAFILSFFTKPNYYGEKTWSLEGEPIEQGAPTKEEVLVLDLIRKGYNTMGEITDYLQTDSYHSNSLVESLDKKRLLKREKLWGPGFYLFELTAAGEKVLPVLNEKEVALVAQNLTLEEVGLLNAINEGVEQMYAYVEANGFNSLKASILVSQLVKYDYLKEGGLFKRSLTITEKGLAIIK